MFKSPMHFYIHHYGTDEDIELISRSAMQTQAAIQALGHSDTDSARELWKQVDGDRLFETWNNQVKRFAKVGRTWKERREIARGEKTSPVSESLARKIYELDGYRCVYCDLPVFTKWPGSPLLDLIATFPELTPSLRIENGKLRGTGKNGALRNADYAKFLWSLAACDHVFPSSLGGPTDVTNLVTSCSGCNYSKGNLTLDQMDVDYMPRR